MSDQPNTAELIEAIDRLRESIERQHEEPIAYDLETAARKVCLSKRKLQELVEQGRLRVVRIDRRVLVTPEALRDLLDRG